MYTCGRDHSNDVLQILNQGITLDLERPPLPISWLEFFDFGSNTSSGCNLNDLYYSFLPSELTLVIPPFLVKVRPISKASTIPAVRQLTVIVVTRISLKLILHILIYKFLVETKTDVTL